jgi:predicted TIM-barrel fold metal-dependent hydrolase
MSDTIVDAEFHGGAPALADLLPFMDSSWAERMTRTRFSLPSAGMHPGGGVSRAGANAASPESMSAELDSAVQYAILLPHQIMPAAGWCDTKMCSIYASAINRYMLEKWIPQNDRFRLALALSPHEPAEAAAEIHAHARNPAVAAVSFSPLAINLGQTHYQQIFAAAAEHGLPVIIHPSGGEGLVQGTPQIGGVGPRVRNERWVLLPQVAAANIASLIYDGIFVQWPELKVVIAGFGFDWVLPLIWRVDMEWRNLRMDVPWITESPMCYLEKNIRLVVNDLAGSPDMARHVASTLPEQALLYGSNRPFDTSERSEILTAFPVKLRDRIASVNSRETFRFQ